MYNCEICGTTSTPRQIQRKYVISRLVPAEKKVFKLKIDERFVAYEEHSPMREEIAREIKVCVECHEMINNTQPEMQARLLDLMMKTQGKVQRLSQRMQIKLKVKKFS